MEISNGMYSSQLLQRSSNSEQNVSTRNETVAEVQKDFSVNEDTGLEKVDKQQVKDITEKFNNFLDPNKTALKFQFHDKLDEYYVTIINPETKEVLKEIPPKKLLDVYAAMAEFMGFIVDEKI
ncbi:flagellar protein FlaG [Radiobacillus deserti]|uniref:Flagellar protein FlaG n=1 Tax=Radiobacillus deserti TaxID=2594883 RepID=A0A516KIQ6_9BACI|nr:flagellar protein FlaG [Radiobacillus deserti]QDP41272.1 flagellar protein FlaG [Radiobacillus deserti]